MERKTGKSGVGAQEQDRQDRLKAALKSNLAKRKAQARARSEETGRKPGAKE